MERNTLFLQCHLNSIISLQNTNSVIKVKLFDHKTKRLNYTHIYIHVRVYIYTHMYILYVFGVNIVT